MAARARARATVEKRGSERKGIRIPVNKKDHGKDNQSKGKKWQKKKKGISRKKLTRQPQTVSAPR